MLPDYVRSLPSVALSSLIIYLFLIAGFKIIGRRQLGQLNVIDLVIIIIMGSAVETSMVAGNLSLPAGFVSAATLLVANRLFFIAAQRWHWLGRLVSSGPVLVISDGRLVQEHLKRHGLTESDVLEAIRERGFCEAAEVKFAVIEEDGEINAVGMDHPTVLKTEEVARS